MAELTIKSQRVATISDQVQRDLTRANRRRPSLHAVIGPWEQWHMHGSRLDSGRSLAQLVGSYHAHNVFDRLDDFKADLEEIERDFISQYEATLAPSELELMGQKMAERMRKELDRQLMASTLLPPMPKDSALARWRREGVTVPRE